MTAQIYSKMRPLPRSTLSKCETMADTMGWRFSGDHGKNGLYRVLSYDCKTLHFSSPDIDVMYEWLSKAVRRSLSGVA